MEVTETPVLTPPVENLEPTLAESLSGSEPSETPPSPSETNSGTNVILNPESPNGRTPKTNSTTRTRTRQSRSKRSSRPRGRPPGAKNKPKANPPSAGAGTGSEPAELTVRDRAVKKPPGSLGRTGAPNADEWQHWLEYALTLAVGFYTDFLINPIEDELDEDDRKLVDEMNSDFVREFSEPLSKILARNALNKTYGRPIVDSYDWLGLIIAAWAYRRDTRELRDRHRLAVRQKRLLAQNNQPQPQREKNNAQPETSEPAPPPTALIAVPPGAASG